MAENLNGLDRIVVTNKFLRDISDYSEKVICGKKLNIEEATQAYIHFRDCLNSKMKEEGRPFLTDSYIMKRIRTDKNFYDINLNLILLKYIFAKISDEDW